MEISLSLGLATMDEQTPDLATLLTRAISALEQAKLEGGSRSTAWSGEHMISTQKAELEVDVARRRVGPRP